jgi:hypothetical protein
MMEALDEYLRLVLRHWYVLFVGGFVTIISAVWQGTSGLHGKVWVVALALTLVISQFWAFVDVRSERNRLAMPPIRARVELLPAKSVNQLQLVRLRVFNDGPRAARLTARVEELDPPDPDDPEPPWPVPWRGNFPLECPIPHGSSEILKVATVPDVNAVAFRRQPEAWRPSITCLLAGPGGEETHPAFFRDYTGDDGFLGMVRSLRVAIRDADDGTLVASGWLEMSLAEDGPGFVIRASLRGFD